MSYQERRSLINIIETIITTGGYVLFMAQRYPDVDAYSVEMFRFWGTFFLLLILVSIVVKIIINILFIILYTVIAREEQPTITDERDHMIELRSTRNSLYIFAIGVILAMGSLVLEMPPSTMFILLFMGGFLAGMVSEISEYYFYRRGY